MEKRREQPVTRERSWLWHGAILLGGLTVAYLLASIGVPTRSVAVTRFAVFLQFAGLVTVALGIGSLRRELRLPTLAREIGDDVSRTVRRALGRHRVVEAYVGDVNPAQQDSARGWHALKVPGHKSTRRKRDEYMQGEIQALQEAVVAVENRLDAETRERASAVEQLAVQSRTDDARLWERVERISAGGLRLEIIGVVWLAVGVLIPAFERYVAALWR